MNQLGVKKLGKYELLDVLGHGATGIVYLAKDTLLRREVALKVVNVGATDEDRIIEEARVLDKLDHPNIVKVYGVDRVNNQILLAMERIRGRNLLEILKEDSAIPSTKAVSIVVQVLDALDYAHRMHIIHRDIKPANILLDIGNKVKLVDFGLAEILATNAYAGGAGTYAYMAPEDFAEQQRSDHLSDLWAVGVMLYEMLTGHRPFVVHNPKNPMEWQRVLESGVQTPIVKYIPDAPAELQAIFTKALATSKSLRYQSASEFRNALRTLVGIKINTAQQNSNDVDGEAQTDALNPLAVVGKTQPATNNGTHSTRKPLPPASLQSKPTAVNPGGGNLALNYTSVDFGTVHQGTNREVYVAAKLVGAKPPVDGKITYAPRWVVVSPPVFNTPKQTIHLTAVSSRVPTLGDIEDHLQVNIDGATIQLPLKIHVLPTRPTFAQVIHWYLPLLISALLPVLSVFMAMLGNPTLTSKILSYLPAGAMLSGILATMLLLICIVHGIRMLERVVVMLVIGAMFGILTALATQNVNPQIIQEDMKRATIAGIFPAIMVCCQLFTMSRWQWWAFVLSFLGIVSGIWLLSTISIQISSG